MNELQDQKTNAYDFLKTKILDCEIKPGEYINDKELSESCGYGRTPIREAMILLQKEGLIEVVPRKGTYAKKFVKEEIFQLFDIRKTIEPVIACNFLNNIDLKKLVEIESQMQKMCLENQEIDDIKDYYRLDIEFHSCIFSSCNNPRMIEMFTPIFQEAYRYGIYNNLAKTEQTKITTYKEHKRILNAILEADRNAIMNAFTAHLNTSMLSSLLALDKDSLF